MPRYEDEEERLERIAAEYRENMAISTMDPAEREYLERRRFTSYGEPIEYYDDSQEPEEEPEPRPEMPPDAPHYCSNCGEGMWSAYRIDGDILCPRCFHVRTALPPAGGQAMPSTAGAYVAGNVASILAVPLSILPAGPARDELLESARSGADTYCYAPIQLEERPERKRWNVWLAGRRHDIGEWLATYASQEQELDRGETDNG